MGRSAPRLCRLPLALALLGARCWASRVARPDEAQARPRRRALAAALLPLLAARVAAQEPPLEAHEPERGEIWPPVFGVMDENKDGVADRLEFMLFMRDMLLSSGNDDKSLRDAAYEYTGQLYDVVDVNGNEVLDRREVQFGQYIADREAKAARRGEVRFDLGKQMNEKRHAHLDVNRDGGLDLQEFAALWTSGQALLGLQGSLPPALAPASNAAAFFAEVDLDGDGALAPLELDFATFLVTDAAFRETTAMLFEALDHNRDGMIDQQELDIANPAGMTELDAAARVRYGFDAYDTNGDGLLDWSEAAQGVVKVM